LLDYAKTILFDTGKSSIKAESEEVLKNIVAILAEYKNSKFTIDGHTDSVGSAALNQKLSEERAYSVMNYLIENGVASSRLSAAGYGEDRPIASNNTRQGRRTNRRVEINLVK
jgi:outer membrane protein OmpA-like peptidoglycan-associated protein